MGIVKVHIIFLADVERRDLIRGNIREMTSVPGYEERRGWRVEGLMDLLKPVVDVGHCWRFGSLSSMGMGLTPRGLLYQSLFGHRIISDHFGASSISH